MEINHNSDGTCRELEIPAASLFRAPVPGYQREGLEPQIVRITLMREGQERWEQWDNTKLVQ